MAADGSVIIEILGDASDVTSKLKGIAGGALKALTGAIAATGTALAGVAGASLKIGSEFEASMSQVASVSGAVGEDFDRLKQKAMEMGATTKFSASESAEAMNYMAMAGWKTEDMLGGIEGIMDLAAASGESLGRTSDIVTDALTAFGLSAADSGHFADVLAAASSNANTNVSMLGESFKYAAPLAGAMNYSVEDVAVALGLMANAGIKASMGGTAFRSAMTQMLKPSETTAIAMEKLGLYSDGVTTALQNADGSAKSLEETMIILRSAFAGLSETEQSYYAAQIFGTEAMSGMLAIINASEEDFVNLSSAIATADGAAKKMADTMQDNLQGDITTLKSGIEGLGIALFDVMEGPARGAVQSVTEAVRSISEAITGTQDQEALLKSIGDTLNQSGVQWENYGHISKGVLSDMYNDIVHHVTELGTSASDLQEYLQFEYKIDAEDAKRIIDSVNENVKRTNGGIEVAIEEAGRQISSFATKIASNAPAFIDAGVSMIRSFLQGIHDNLSGTATAAVDIVTSLVNGILELLPQFLEVGLEIIISIAQGIAEALPQLVPKLAETIAEIVRILTQPDTLAALLEAGLQIIAALADGLVQAIPVLIEALPEIITNIIDSITRLLPQITSSGIQIIVTLVNGIIDALPALIEAIPQIIVALVTGILDNLDQIILAGPQIMLALCEGVIGAIPSLIQLVPQLFVALVDAFTSVDWGSIGKNIVDGIKNGISQMWNNLVSWVQNLVQNLISAAKNILSGSFKSGGTSKSAGGSTRSGSSARSAPMRSAPAVQSVSDDAEPALMSVRASAPALGTPVALNAQSDMVSRLRNAVEAEQSRMSAQMNVSSGSRGSGFSGAQSQNSNGQTPNIIVRPNVVIKAEGDLAPLARIFKPALDAEDRRVGVGVT